MQHHIIYVYLGFNWLLLYLFWYNWRVNVNQQMAQTPTSALVAALQATHIILFYESRFTEL